METRRIFEFGPFRLDTGQRLLFRGSETLPLTPKSVDLLIALIESRGQVVAKEALLQRVWPDAFVEEINLSKGVFLIRKALGDGYVETLPKRGYRFIADVRELGAEPANAAAPPLDPPSQKRVGRRSWIAAAGVVALTGAGFTVWNPRPEPPRINSVVVLPFVNLSGGPENEHFSDGLTQELVNRLAAIEGLRVVARTSAFRFKGKQVDIREVGRLLNADGVIEGSVRTDGSRVRVTVQLNSARDGYHFWAKSFEREAAKIFEVQDEVAQAVAQAIGLDTGGVKAPSIHTRNAEAYNLYLRGEYLRQRREMMDQGFTLFQQAASLDPSFAESWAGQALCYHLWAARGRKPPNSVYPAAVETAQRALSLNPNLAGTHALLGRIHMVYSRDWPAAKKSLDRALELDPDHGEAHHEMSHYWVTLGDFPRAREESLKAQSCDPLNVSIASHLAFELGAAGRYQEAVEAAEKALELDPRHSMSLLYMQTAYERWGKLDSAIATRRRAAWLDPPPDALERALAKEGRVGYFRLRLDAARRHYEQVKMGAFEAARLSAFLGRKPDALDWLAKAVENHERDVMNMKYDPTFQAMRGDPPFLALCRQAGIP